MGSNKPFGLVIPKKSKAFQPKKTGVFGSDSDDDIPPKKKFAKIPQSKPISSMKIDETVDPSIYEYDTIYDDIKAQKVADTAPKEKKSSRYIDNLLKAADKRKKEYERRVEKKVQVEREKEGNKYEDKEMFVTSAYKKKMEEREEEEERERRENMLNDMMDVTKQKDLSGFYRHFLKQSVGEEKIPVFGEKVAIKEEPKSDSDGEKATHMNKNLPTESEELYEDDKDLSDSDDSDSEKSDVGNENSYEKSVREYRKRPVEESSEEEATHSSKMLKSNKNSPRKSIRKDNHDEFASSSSKTNNTKGEQPNSQKGDYRKLSTRSSDDEISNESPKTSKSANERHEKSQKISSTRNLSRHQESELAETSDSSESDSNSNKNLPSSSRPHNGVKESTTSATKENSERKTNIFIKRCVGEAFAAAQARYFQRLAARS